MSSIQGLIAKAKASPWLAEIIAVLGAACYGVQSFIYAHQLQSTLDEGNYLYKGYLFATGVYNPFQDYGPLTNKMPFAFLIPGWFEAILGPGLRTGRYTAIFFGLMMLLGLWLTARHLGGRWWGAAIVWAVAINPILIKMYSQAISEGISAFLLAWILALTLGKERKLWQVGLGAFLTAVIVITRENMIPVVPFVLIYIFWEHGRRAGWISLLAAGLPFILVFAIYWPNILKIWLPWIPFKTIPFLDNLRRYAAPAWNLGDTGLISRLFAFWEGMRQHFIPVVGAIAAVIFWPKKKDWKSDSAFRIAVILTSMLAVLIVTHALASVSGSYCVYCFGLYMSFFIEIGLVIVVVTIGSWRLNNGTLAQVIAILATMGLATGLAFGSHQEFDDALLRIQIPRVRNLQILPGSTELWRMLANKFGASYDTLQQIIPTATGFLVGFIIVLASMIAWMLLRKRALNARPGYMALLSFFVLGTLFTPSVVLGGGNRDPKCGDVIAAYEAAGQQLKAELPEGVKIDWHGGLSPVPLLYLSNVSIYPPQLNDGYSMMQSMDTERLYKEGYWNAELSTRWLNEADVILVEGWRLQKGLEWIVSSGKFEEMPATPAIYTCQNGSQIRVFRRK